MVLHPSLPRRERGSVVRRSKSNPMTFVHFVTESAKSPPGPPFSQGGSHAPLRKEGTSGGGSSTAAPLRSPLGNSARIAACLPQQGRRKAWGFDPWLSQAAFTLLEVMVALAILALGLVTVLELFAGSLRLGAKASRHTEATIYAQNEMNRLFARPTLEEGEESGELPDGYFWRARVQEIHPEEAQTRFDSRQQNPTDLFHLYTLEVTVSWREDGSEQTLTLRSLRTTAEDQGNL